MMSWIQDQNGETAVKPDIKRSESALYPHVTGTPTREAVTRLAACVTEAST